MHTDKLHFFPFPHSLWQEGFCFQWVNRTLFLLPPLPVSGVRSVKLSSFSFLTVVVWPFFAICVRSISSLTIGIPATFRQGLRWRKLLRGFLEIFAAAASMKQYVWYWFNYFLFLKSKLLHSVSLRPKVFGNVKKYHIVKVRKGSIRDKCQLLWCRIEACVVCVYSTLYLLQTQLIIEL